MDFSETIINLVKNDKHIYSLINYSSFMNLRIFSKGEDLDIIIKNKSHYDKPVISIIMGVYNTSETISQAIESILAQTFKEWELIICDDGSTDDTLQICREYEKIYRDRIRVIFNEENQKLAATLNRCLELVRGNYVARMDGDDISAPERLSKQLDAILSQPGVDLVGTDMRRFNEFGQGGLVSLPEKPDRYALLRSVPFCHATVLAKRRVFDQIGGYNESGNAERVEDLDLWFRFYEKGFVGINLNQPLYMVREDVSAFRRRTFKSRWNVFRTRVAGYRKLGYPFYYYLYPLVDLGKGLVPLRFQQEYRRWQQAGSNQD